MNKKLLEKCLYFKGEDECPANVKKIIRGRMYWRAEQLWVTAGGAADGSSLSLLNSCGLDDASLKRNGDPASLLKVPQNLRAILFGLLRHYSDESPEHDAHFFVSVVLPRYAGSTVI